MRLLFLLLLAGCSTTSVDELFSRARACATDCDALWDEYNRAAEMQERRKARRAPKCPDGLIWYCDHWSCHGRNPMTAGQCVEAKNFGRIFRWSPP